VPDAITTHIASKVSRIVNLPMDTASAWKILEQLHLDIILFPDWQPFPDQQSALFQNTRIAPVQACFYVRGGSCVALAVDYYLMPQEMEDTYLKGVPAADSKSTKKSITMKNINPIKVQLRPPWLEAFNEQVVLLDWPVITPYTIKTVINIININNDNDQKDSTVESTYNSNFEYVSDSIPDPDMTPNRVFPPTEVEGQIFFEGQPVAVIAVHPTFIHPLMDDVIFKIMNAQPLLQVVIILSDSFFGHIKDPTHRMTWGRKVVRRLWAKAGNLYHRIRLLPSPLSDYRLLHILSQADMVLDSFPIGGSFHVNSLALSVGTPVVTFSSGSLLSTPKEDLKNIKIYLNNVLQKQKKEELIQKKLNIYKINKVNKNRIESNPMFRRLATPYNPYPPTANTHLNDTNENGLKTVKNENDVKSANSEKNNNSNPQIIKTRGVNFDVVGLIEKKAEKIGIYMYMYIYIYVHI
jgi:hypothetical protein